jgi:hypothetical protein
MAKKLKHGVHTLAKSGQFDQEFYLDLVNDYGGLEEIGTARKALCKQAAWRRLLLENIMLFIAESGVFVSDRRHSKNPKVSPLVALATSIMNALRQDLLALGLDKRRIEKRVPSLDEWIRQEKAKEAEG